MRWKDLLKSLWGKVFGVGNAEPKSISISMTIPLPSRKKVIDIVVPSLPAQIVVTRKEFSNEYTIGDLSIYNEFECYTIEDTTRHHGPGQILKAGEKVPGETAIPQGKYRLVLAHSKKFGYCPWILDVPFFSDIRIHSGNTAKDSLGCILVGKTKGEGWVGESRMAFRSLVDRLDSLDEHEELWIEIVGGMSPEQYKLLTKAV